MQIRSKKTPATDPTSEKKRIGPYLDEDTHKKLKKLAVACDTNKTDLAARIIKMAVNHPDIIEHLQSHYNQDPDYRVIPIVDANDPSKIYY
jgi:hypothetical protein